MQNCELTREEIDVLREVLDHSLNELDIEIRRTDTPAFKSQLKRRRAILDGILTKLAAAPTMA